MKSYKWSCFAIVLAGTLASPGARAQTEDAKCRSPNPADWPASPKPYFLLAVDTSGSMAYGMAQNSCGYPRNRSGGARCAVYNTVRAFSGLVNFGLMAFARMPIRDLNETPPDALTAADDYLSTNTLGCNVASLYSDSYGGMLCQGCGYTTRTDNGALSRGSNLLVPLQADTPTSTSNISEILAWVDNRTSDCKELWAEYGTPLNGMLRDAQLYLSTEWLRPGPDTTACTSSTQCFVGLRCLPPTGGGRNCEDVWPACDATHACPTGSTCNGAGRCAFPTPLTGSERSCRSVNVVLVTDGEEFCDASNFCRNDTTATDATDAARHLFEGFDIGSVHWKVRTHVIALGPAAGVDNIAAAGDTGQAYIANNEADLSAALANIIAGAIPPEVCDNQDNNCNGCTDEGSRTYCNRGRQASAAPSASNQCCQWTTKGERDTCLANHGSSIGSSKPQGDLWLLPCWDPTAVLPSGMTSRDAWLCVDPREECDEMDNNCDASWDLTSSPPPANQVDEGEGFRKCVRDSSGDLKCPATEVCDGIDNDCDDVRDNAPGGCPTPCVPSPEICDGRDNDCDTQTDEGLEIPCGLPAPAPARCQGVRSCAGGKFTECSWQPETEICNGEDDDCDGLIDEGAPTTPCVPTGLEGVIFYDPVTHPDTRCRMGEQPCGGDQCIGGVGPLPGGETCNGLDDDCDGQVDNCPVAKVNIGGVEYCTALGEGNECGSAVGTCTKGRTVCASGFLDCTGGVGPQPERCDGIDSDCDGVSDDKETWETLVDAPQEPGCWNKPRTDLDCDPLAANCSQGALEWCAPQGATCHGSGVLSSPCTTGTLACVGSMWICQGGRLPGTEVCDGADNDCDTLVDDSLAAPIVGQACGEDKGECKSGLSFCDAGQIRCDGQGPTEEICDSKDNDCDGTIDNGLGLGDTCTVKVDASQYPGDRSLGLCRPGRSQCDPAGTGLYLCVEGVGPQPEVCDGLDNDCDGQIDEVGRAPDGIDGTADPANPNQRLGDACGNSEGLCQPGHLTCLQGRVSCTGGLGAQAEICDCADNNCNATVDEDPPADSTDPRICSRGKSCVKTSQFCVCAQLCGDGEFACPTGTTCQTVFRSGTDETGNFCVPADPCGNCASETVAQPGAQAGILECGPAGTLSQGKPVPVCVCKGQIGCHSPCYNVTCSEGQACVSTGQFAGQCQPANDCRFLGCDTGRVCHDGACVIDPCYPNPCSSDQVCKPNASFSDHRCVGSCALVTCSASEQCNEGTCVASNCANGCPVSQFCQAVEDGGFGCGPSQCLLADGGAVCAAGTYCDPATGQCGDDPCTGVVCPAGQVCGAGNCTLPEPTTDAGTGGGGALTPTGGRASTGGRGGEVSSDATPGETGTGNAPYQEPTAWGLATGGGGCSCTLAGRHRTWPAASALALLGLLVTVGRRRRRGRAAGADAARRQGGVQ